MEENINQQIASRISALPQELKERLQSPWRTVIDSVSQKQNLTEDQKESLENEVFMVLAGLEPISKFRQNLMNELGVTYDQAVKITYELNNNVFNPVMNVLKTIEEQIKVVDDEEDRMIYLSREEEKGETGEETQDAKETVFTAQPMKEETPRTTPDINPEHLVPDHDGMEKLDGPHLHSQTATPTEQKPDLNSRFGSFIPQAKKSFGSIVDEKLSGIVTSNTENNTLSEKPAPKNGYTGQDPYREPIE